MKNSFFNIFALCQLALFFVSNVSLTLNNGVLLRLKPSAAEYSTRLRAASLSTANLASKSTFWNSVTWVSGFKRSYKTSKHNMSEEIQFVFVNVIPVKEAMLC